MDGTREAREKRGYTDRTIRPVCGAQVEQKAQYVGAQCVRPCNGDVDMSDARRLSKGIGCGQNLHISRPYSAGLAKV